MSKEEANIRKAATALLAAVEAGREAGLEVQWPQSAAGLGAIAISETARATPPDAQDGSDKAK